MAEQYDNSGDRGALWARKTKAGDTYFTGEINGERVVAWLNRSATPESKQPTYRIKLDKPMDGAAAPAPAPADLNDEIPF